MAQFTVYRNPNAQTRQRTPYLLNVQSDLLDVLATSVVVPLVPAADMGVPARHLNPQFDIEGVTVVMSTAELAGVPRQALGAPVTTLVAQRSEILAALDFLFTGI